MTFVQVTKETSGALLRQALETRQNAHRICTRSAELITQALVVQQATIPILARLAAARAERRRERVRRGSAAGFWIWNKSAVPLPLRPPMLLKLADEFRLLGEGAMAPEVKAAFHGLALRYTALAGGFDTRAMTSRRLH